MPNFRRSNVAGGTYFFTVVTENRSPLFSNDHARTILSGVMRECQSRHPHEVVALVLLPDHLHAIWALPSGDDRYGMRWAWIKREFTRQWIASGGIEQQTRVYYPSQRRRGVWQPRYWEHAIRDDADFQAHFDYIHYNPVKHEYVKKPRDWPWSSFHRWVREGHYSIDWAAGVEGALPGSAGE